MRDYALVLLVTAAVTYLLVPLVRRIAIGTRAMHEPRARDVHTAPTPLLGGLAMYGGMVVGLIIASRLSYLKDPFSAAGSRTEAGLLLAGGLIVLIGFIDDRWGLSAISKLAGQVAAAGIVVWSGQSLPWLPEPNGHVFSLEPDLSVVLTILLIVVTINAINFIDGLDGLAAGITGIAAMSFLVYSYTLVRTLNDTSQSLPAVSSALLAGMCVGFLPHNYFPARIFMGDIGAALLGLLLAYGPISSTNSLDSTLLSNYSQDHPYNRFGTILPLLVAGAIFLIPYTDLMLAVIRRTRRGKPVMAADREHLHHRLLGIGHSYRQSVLIMWLWAALFSATVISLSLVRSRLWVLVVATVVAVLTLLPVTMPRLRPWRLFGDSRRVAVTVASAPAPVQLGTAQPGTVQPGTGSRVAPASAFAPKPNGAGPGKRRAAGSGNGGPPPGFEPITTPSATSSVLRPFPGDADRAARRLGHLPVAPAADVDSDAPFPRAGRLPGEGEFPLDHANGHPQFPSNGHPWGDPGSGQLPDDLQRPGSGALPDNGPFRGNGQVAGNGQVWDNGEVRDNGQIAADGYVRDSGQVWDNGQVAGNEDRFADTGPFPASPGRGPRPS